MRTRYILAAVFGLSLASLNTPAFAQLGATGELHVSGWSDPMLDADSEGDSINGVAELWWDKNWGIRSARRESTFDALEDESSEHLSIDLKRRFFSPLDQAYLALGAGWESIDLVDGESSSGLRLTAEGRFGLGDVFYLYGQTSWLPELDDTGTRSNLAGQEFEAGFRYDPAPSMSIRLGFRSFRLDYDQAGESNSTQSNGVILGAGFNW
ncbi:MAG: hypothetical protein DHS20C01_11410 [marine bacterium B5-7]|nr:MAG: hypothetical protein DHS20C01_11410 [marine bacterium B5-7]